MQISHAYIFENTDTKANQIEVEKFLKGIYNQEDLENNPDYTLIKCLDKSIKISQIRDLQKDILVKPIKFEKKVYVIENAETMTVEAQNALLKILEEPPEYAMIILETTMYFSLLETIRSRCIRVKNKSNINNNDFVGIDESKINAILSYIGKNDKLGFLRQSTYFEENKDNIYKILEYMMIYIRDTAIGTYGNKNLLKFDGKCSNIAGGKVTIDNYYKCIEIIEDTYRKLKQNGNFQMCIDEMLMKLSHVMPSP